MQKNLFLLLIKSFLQVFYQDYEYKFPKLLPIPGCGTFCPFDNFYEMIKEELPCKPCRTN